MNYIYCYHRLKNKRVFLVLLLIVTLGFILRLYHLGAPSLWSNELWTEQKIKYPLPQLMKIPSVHYNPPFYHDHPPLYYIIVKFWVRIFGNSEFALRFPSLIFSVLSIIFIFKLAKELFNEKIGLTSAFLLSISAYSINYAQEAKMYSMLWFWAILSFLFFYKFIKDNKIKDLVLYIIVTTSSIYTMYLGFIFIIIQNITFFLFSKKEQFKRWLLGQTLIILLFLPQIGHLLYLIINRPTLKWMEEVPKRYACFGFLRSLLLVVTGLSIGKLNWVEFFLYCFLILSAIIWFKNIKQKKNILNFSQSDCILLFWLALPLIAYCLLSFHFTRFATKYLGFIHIPLIILFSKAINKYNFKVKCGLLIFLVFSIFSNHLYPYYKYNLKIEGENWRALTKQLDKRAGENDLIVCIYYYPPLGLQYYGKGLKAKYIRYQMFVKQDTNKLNYDSIFFVYVKNQLKKYKIPELNQYKIKEHYSNKGIGFLHFQRQY